MTNKTSMTLPSVNVDHSMVLADVGLLSDPVFMHLANSARRDEAVANAATSAPTAPTPSLPARVAQRARGTLMAMTPAKPKAALANRPLFSIETQFTVDDVADDTALGDDELNGPGDEHVSSDVFTTKEMQILADLDDMQTTPSTGAVSEDEVLEFVANANPNILRDVDITPAAAPVSISFGAQVKAAFAAFCAAIAAAFARAIACLSRTPSGYAQVSQIVAVHAHTA